jgi:hypothetical protein
MTICGVCAHHQNGKVERHLRDLQELSRSSILHAQKIWPDAINTFLWPYAICKASHDMNLLKRDQQGKSPMEKFSNTTIKVNVNHFHTFGCMYCKLRCKVQLKDQNGTHKPVWLSTLVIPIIKLVVLDCH